MPTKCFSVRLQTFVRVSDKCFKAIAFDGSEALIPSSQYLGQDYDVLKSDTYWISAWILDKKELQYSSKKEVWFDDNGKMLPKITIERHIPNPIQVSDTYADESLTR